MRSSMEVVVDPRGQTNTQGLKITNERPSSNNRFALNMLRYLRFLLKKPSIYISIILYLFQVNSVLFITLLCRINRVSKFRESMTRVQHVKAWLRRSLILMPVLGITWSFGLLTFISSTIVFHYLFTIFNSLQGFVIFFNFCVLDSEVGFLVILVTTVNLDSIFVVCCVEIFKAGSARGARVSAVRPSVSWVSAFSVSHYPSV